MKQVIVRKGAICVEDVPAPQVAAGRVLVHVDNTCISPGTEMSGVTSSGTPLWKRALQNPEQVKLVAELLVKQGWSRTQSMVQGTLSAGQPTGYSVAGTVLEVGRGVGRIRVGAPVACAGAQCAHHAEIVCVPENLVVPVPAGLSTEAASTVALGAIALQGVRRAEPTLGEVFAVLGLGFLGQLTAQILKANGCSVIGTDLDEGRVKTACDLGMDVGLMPGAGDLEEQAARLTDGIGVDGVIVTASGQSDAIIATAFGMCRKKGRVVLVGDVGLGIQRSDIYRKELDFFISTSYGPGRYDRRYEEEGLDYPVSHVRWTENRNMSAYLTLLSEGKVRVEPLIGGVLGVDRAPEAFGMLKGDAGRPPVVVLSYPGSGSEAGPKHVTVNPRAKRARSGLIRLGLAGAGPFARSMHLPNIHAMKDTFHLRAVMSRTGHSAKSAAGQFGADYSTTDYEEMLKDAEIDAILICTPHDTHSAMTLRALDAGKHVFVEKPLTLTRDGLAAIRDFYESRKDDGVPVLQTGFNRRFSAFAGAISEIMASRTNPMVLNYRMNAGYRAPTDTVHGQESGGRNLGEACHIYDLFTYFTSARVSTVQVSPVHPATDYYTSRDNFVATICFDDGSLATLTYTAMGSPEFPKEMLDVWVDGRSIALRDYVRLEVSGRRVMKKALQDKGHAEELRMFASCIRSGGDWPIPLWQQVQATETALTVEEQLTSRS